VREIDLLHTQLVGLQNAHQNEKEMLASHVEQRVRGNLESELNSSHAKVQQEKMAAEAHNKHLALRVDDSNQQLIKATDEINRITGLLLDKQREVDQLRGNLQVVEAQMHNLKGEMEFNKKVVVEKEVGELNVRFAQERVNLQSLIESLQGKQMNYEIKSVLLMTEIERLHNALNDKQTEIENWAIEIERVNALVLQIQQDSENWRVKALSAEKSQESLRYQLEIEIKAKLNKEYDAKIIDLRNQFEQMMIGRIEIEIKNASVQWSAERNNLEAQLRSQKIVIDGLENRSNMLNAELEKRSIELGNKQREFLELQGRFASVADKDREIEGWRLKCSSLEKSRIAEIESLKSSFDINLKNRIELERAKLFSEVDGKFAQERLNLESSIIQFKAKIQDSDVRLVLLMAEIERLHGVVGEKHKDVEAMAQRHTELEGTHKSAVQGLKQGFEKHLKATVDAHLSDAEVQIKNLQGRITELEVALSGQTQTKDQYFTKITELTRLSEEWKSKYNNLQYEHERSVNDLQIEIQSKMRLDFENQTKALTSKFLSERSELENQIRQLKGTLQEYEKHSSGFSFEIEKSNSEKKALLQEIEIWKSNIANLEKANAIKIKDLESQFESRRKYELEISLRESESKWGSEKATYDASVKLFKQKITEYENRITILTQEVDRQSKIGIDRMNEIESWKLKYAQLEKNVNIHLEEIKLQWEGQKQKDLEAYAKALYAKFGDEKGQLETQINFFKTKYAESEDKYNRFFIESDTMRKQFDQLKADCESWRSRYQQLENSKNMELEHTKASMEHEKKAHVDRELKNHELKSQVERSQTEAKLKDLQKKMVEYEGKLVYLTQEVDRLTRLLMDKEKELDNWKMKTAEVDHQRITEVEEAKIQFESLRRSSIGQSDTQIRFAAERSAFETQIMQLRQKLSEYELRIGDLSKENQRVNQLIVDKQKELQMISEKFSHERGGSSYEMEELKRELDMYRRQNSDTKEFRTKLELEKGGYESQIVQLKQIIDTNRGELQKLYDLNNTRKSENEALIKQLNDSRMESAKLSQSLKSVETDFLTKGGNNNQMQREIEELVRSRDMYKAQLERNNLEITKKNKELIERIQEVDALKMKYEDALNNMEHVSMTGSKVITRTSYVDKKY
jgi:chromosome segregation ATPase